MKFRLTFAVALATCLLTLLSMETGAQEPLDGAMPWQVQSFREDAGLDDRVVHFMDFDSDGSVWLAVTDGLYHFDGYDWMRYTSDDGLPSSYVRCVCVAQDGLLWIGTDRGVATFDGTRFDASLTAGKLAGPSVRRIVEDPDGSIWFCCDQWPERRVTSGLSRLKDGEFTTWRTDDGLPSDYVSDYFRDSQGRQFVLTALGLAQFTENGFCMPWKDAGLSETEQYVWSMVESSQHGLVAATRTHCFQFQGDTWTQYPNKIRVLPAPKLLATRDGEIFALSDDSNGRFFRWKNGSFVDTIQKIGLPGGVELLVEDGAGAIWACGTKMLFRWERMDPTWQQYRKVGAPQVCDQSGAVWFSDRDGVCRFHDQQWQSWDDLAGPVLETKNGRLWMSHSKGLAYWQQEKHVRIEGESQINHVSVVGEDRLGTVWATGNDAETGNPVVAFVEPTVSDPHQLSVIPIAGVLRNRTIENVEVDPLGGLWCVVGHKTLPPFCLINIKNDGDVSEVALPEDAQMNNPPKIHVAVDGRLWINGFFGALTREANGDQWTRFETPTRLIHQIASVGDETISNGSGILGGTANLSRWTGSMWSPISNLEGRIVGKYKNHMLFVSSKRRIWTVNPVTGAVEPPITLPIDLGVGSVVADESRERWVWTDKHTFRYRPSTEPPQTRIDRADSKLGAGDLLRLSVRGVARFRPMQSDGDFFASHRVDEGPWSPFEPLDDEIEIPDLAVGEHNVQVRVINENGIVDPTPAGVAIQVLPIPLQQRVGFQLAMMVVFIVVVGLAIAATTSRARLRHLAQALEARVQEQTMALGTSERKYRALFEESADPICLFGFDGELRDQNKAAVNFLDIKPGTTWSISKLFVTTSDERRFHNLLRNQGFLQGARFQVKNRNNSRFEVLLSANTRSDVADGYQVIMRNITNLVQLEESLRSKQKLEVIGRMAGGISHDFNNFLGVMVQAADFMAATVGEHPEVQRGVNLIMKAAARAKKLIGQIKTFSRSPLTETRVIDTKSVLEEILLLLKTTIDELILLSINLPHDLGRVRANPEQLEQVVANLVDNACQAMPEGGKLLVEGTNIEIDEATALDMNFDQPGSYVLLQFHDTGMGIPTAVLEKIFDPFYTTKPQGKGSGLGLSIVSGIVRQSKGHVRVTSSQDNGSCFHVYLPLCTEPIDVDDKAESPVASRGGDETLLLVEDEPALRELTGKTLESFGYRVFSAENGIAAKQILETDGPQVNLVISDIAMPKMNGFELVEWMRGHFPELPVLLISGYPEPFSEVGPQKLDTPLLSKPVRAAELTARIRELLDEVSVIGPRHSNLTSLVSNR